MPAGEHFVGGARDRLRLLLIEQAEGIVDARGTTLDQRQRMHDCKRHALAGNAEEAPAALGLRAPQPVRRHVDWAEGIFLGADAAHDGNLTALGQVE